jgi:hypothetical protein
MSDESAEPEAIKPKRKHKGLKIAGGVVLVLFGISAIAHTNTSATLKPGVTTHHSTKTPAKTASKTPTKAAETAKRVRSTADTRLAAMFAWMAKDHIESRLTTLHTPWQAMLYDFQNTAAVCLQAIAYGATTQTISTFGTDVGNAATQLGKFNAIYAKIVGAAAKGNGS